MHLCRAVLAQLPDPRTIDVEQYRERYHCNGQETEQARCPGDSQVSEHGCGEQWETLR